MERKNVCQSPEYTMGDVAEFFESEKTRALRVSEIEAIMGDDYDLDRLRELVEADRDGRCIILPKEEKIKKGDKVWYVDKEDGELESGTIFLASYKNGKLDSFSVDFDCGDFDEFCGGAFGRYFFGSKEAAEASLKGDRDAAEV